MFLESRKEYVRAEMSVVELCFPGSFVIHSGFLKYAIICVKNQICAYIAVVK
jgi:hypothetical protein